MKTYVSHSEDETNRFAADFTLGLRQGGLVFFSGDLGVGKSVFARSIIRTVAGMPELEVASPTYTLCQQYETDPPIAHFDLYRLSGIDALDELGWEDMLAQGIVLFEWPFNCFQTLPDDAILIEIELIDETSRSFQFSGNKALIAQIERSLTIRSFLDKSGRADASRQFLSGDASTRSYELIGHQQDILLMNAPAMPDGPIIKDGKPYSQIAHLAEDVSAFVAVAEILRNAGVKTPQIFDQNIEEGLLLTEHLGVEGIIDPDRNPIPDRYMASVELLAQLHTSTVEYDYRISNDLIYRVPEYDLDAMMIEVDLLKQWYLKYEAEPTDRLDDFEGIWHELIASLQTAPKSIVMRDFHSPNILWLEGETDTRRVGVIDFQDAVIGPEAYDVASLAQDARVDIPEDLEKRLVDHYCDFRKQKSFRFDEAVFRESYAIMAAQRATKILGIFVRLDVRDGKPHYRSHIPRIKAYLKRNLTHPVLWRYRDWLETVMEL